MTVVDEAYQPTGGAGHAARQRPPGAPGPAAAEVLAEAGRRRAFAVISHPDAGKSTLTEALALHASAITQAGAVHGKAGPARRHLGLDGDGT